MLILNALTAAILLALLLPFLRRTAAFLAGSAEITPLAYQYLRIMIWRTPFMMLFLAMSILINSDGMVKLAGQGTLLAQAVNIGLDYLLIRVFNLGLYGAAIATVASDVASLLYVSLIYAKAKERTLHFVGFAEDFLRRAAQLIRARAPAAAAIGLVSVRVWCVYHILEKSGGVDAMQIYSVCMNILTFLSMVAQGAQQAMMPILGVLYGEKDYRGVRMLMRYVLKSAYGLAGVFLALLIVFPRVVLNLFNLAPELVSALSEKFDAPVSIRDIREHPTVRELAAFLAEGKKRGAYEARADYPLTQTQKGVLAESLANPDSTIYNLPYYAKLPDGTDLQRLKTAIETAIDAHPGIKMTLFTDEGGEIRARRNDAARPVVRIESCEAFPAASELIRPFRMLDAPLYRVTLYHTRSEQYLFCDFHHILYDGESHVLFVGDVAKAYAGQPVESEAFTAFDAALAEEEERRTERYGTAKAYYENTFGGLDAGCLPMPDRKGVAPASGFLKAPSALDPAAVTAWCKKHNASPMSFYNALFGFVIGKYDFSEEAVFTTIYNGRCDSRLLGAVGMFVKTLPVCCRAENALSVSDYVRATERQIFDSIGNDVFSFAEVAQICGLEPELSLGYQPRLSVPLVLDGRSCETVWMPLDTAKFPLSVDAQVNAGKLVWSVEYRSDRYSEEFIRAFLSAMDQAAGGFLTEGALDRVSLCAEAQAEAIREWNDTDAPIPSDNLCRLFEAQVETHPERTAVIAAGVTLTYGELNRRANRIAHALLRQGLRPEETVGMLLPRTADAVAAEYGILKAGGAFLPMLPDYPDDRIDYCMTDSGSRFVLTTEAFIRERRDLLAGKDYTALPVSRLLEEGEDRNPDLDIPMDALAYCIYTSGSTGRPKGVMIEHGNLCNFVNANEKNSECFHYVSAGKTAFSVAALSFDFSLMEIHLTLLNGMTLCMADEEEILNPLALAKRIADCEVDVISGTPSFLSNLLDIPEAAQSLRRIRLYDLGAEAFPPALYARLREASPEAVIVNGYGPTEATISCISKRIEGLENITIGRPAANVKVWVFDRCGNPLPPCARGELVIGGLGVGRGYRNLPEKTAESFITVEGRRAYKTGDLARFNSDGEIAFFGRLDNQVKLHGLRIELDEIEKVMSAYPSVQQSVALVRENKAGEGYLCAWFTAGEAVDLAALRAHLEKHLARYMVPAVFMQLEKLPMTKNGKVDKKALPEPESRPGLKAGGPSPAVPLNVLEKRLKDMVAQIVQTADFGVTELFRDLGLTSLSSIRLAVQLYKTYGVQINVRELVNDGSIQSVENRILSELLEKRDAPAQTDAGGEPVQKTRSCRLSFTQQGVYAEVQANPDTVQYNIPAALRFPVGTTAEGLENAVRKVVAAHPYILCRFVPGENNEIIQEPIPDFRLEIPVKEMTREAFENEKRGFVRPFDLAAGPAVRFEIIRTDALYLLMDMHHLVCDGASLDLFISQLCQAMDGQEPEKETYSYYDFAAEEKITQETEDFFAQRMAAAEEATMLIPDVFAENLPHTEKAVSVPTDIRAVKGFSRKLSVTPAAVYLAACQIAFGRWVCEDTVAIATISIGRSNLKIENTLGMFVNTLPLVTTLDWGERTADFLRRTAKDFFDTIAHENYPFARIASRYDFHPALSYGYQIGVLNEYRTKAGEVKQEALRLDIAKLPAAVSIEGTEEAAWVQVTYDAALYSEAMMTGLAESIENAVQGLLRCEKLSDISLTAEKQWKILDGYNRPWDLDYNKNDTAASAFRRTARMQPDKTAAVFRDRSWTYRELDELTDRLAAKLYKRACELTGKTSLAEEVAAILLPRDENVFLLPLAAVKAGLAYEPLDPSYPAERLNFMMKDAGVCLLLAEDSLQGLVSEYTGPVLTVSELYGMEDAPEIPEGPKPEDLFILLYTSGSTGTPKGCQIEHRNLVAYAHGVRNDFYTREDTIAAYASFGFDVNMSDVFCTLLNGGTVVLIPEEIRMDLGALAAAFDKYGVTALLLTTQVGVQFLQNYPRLKTLRMLVMGGEKLPAVDPARLSYTIVNGYGPTENCCGVSLFPIRAWEKNIPIGKPMRTIHAYVLDKTGHRLPAGAAGEFCLSGPQVSRGYLNRPDKTAEAYAPSPFDAFRMYHTGDIVRYRQNGDAEFVGRKDGQVKIRGFRIETKEVEAVIRGYTGVRDVTVQAYDYEGGGKYLAAFVAADSPLDAAQLAAYIKTQKPAYMVPAVIMQIDKIPLTVNQKVDKKALPQPKLQKAAYAAPKGKTEEDLCAVFAGVLGVERVSAEDDFFDIGGNSILAMKVVVAAGKAGYSIVYNDVFRHTTPRDLAAFITGAAAEDDSPAADPEVPAVESAALPETGPDGYHYGEIHALLAKNTLDAFRGGERLPLNDVLLLGGTGYLGSHVLHELIAHHEGRLFCFVRPGKGQSGEDRLKATLRAYFGADYAELFTSRITVIEGDAADPASLDAFSAPSGNMTVFNCAASVKHFARGGELERANVESVRNLIEFCLRNHARLVHISTCSVMGDRKNGMPPKSFRLDEHRLYAGQELESNEYVYTKFMAERAVYEAILKRGLRAKVCRMANLAPRAVDGEFQRNYRTNNFMNTLRAYATLGMIGYDALSEQTEFPPSTPWPGLWSHWRGRRRTACASCSSTPTGR